VFEYRVLTNVFGPQRKTAARNWRKLLYKPRCDLYLSVNIVKVIKYRRMGWAGYVAHMGRRETHAGF
jgi:hypothetical protein